MTETSPVVSVVLTTYNRADVVAETVESVLVQTFDDFELIVADDASPDATRSVMAPFLVRDERIRYLRSDVNVGMPANLNRAIDSARGRYIANLHDGDVYSPTLLERWVASLEACPDALFVFNAYRALNPDGSVAKVYAEPLDECNDGASLLRIFFTRKNFDSPVWGTTMVRASAYHMFGLFQPRYGFYADVEMWLRLAIKGRVAYVREPLISLPSREALPRDPVITYGLADRRNVRRMFWSARRRAVRAGLASRSEYTKHVGYALYAEARVAALAAVHLLRRLVGVLRRPPGSLR